MKKEASPPQCLHLAASRIERLTRAAADLLCRPGWTHLGEGPVNWAAEVREQWRFGNWLAAARLALAWGYRKRFPRFTPAELEAYYGHIEFKEFYFRAGDRLDFADETFDFIVSEHFFEHLFLDEAHHLFLELARILKPGGVIRTSVPDADLRTYAKPERPGFPSIKTPWNHHQKHKSRWNVYSLTHALTEAGLAPNPLIYCDRNGNFIENVPQAEDPKWKTHAAHTHVTTIAYLRRLPSLVVDGIKPAAS